MFERYLNLKVTDSTFAAFKVFWNDWPTVLLNPDELPDRVIVSFGVDVTEYTTSALLNPGTRQRAKDIQSARMGFLISGIGVGTWS